MIGLTVRRDDKGRPQLANAATGEFLRLAGISIDADRDWLHLRFRCGADDVLLWAELTAPPEPVQTSALPGGPRR